jgi:hypothetical protein
MSTDGVNDMIGIGMPEDEQPNPSVALMIMSSRQ